MKVEEIPFTELLSNVVDNRGKTCPTADNGIPLIATNCIRNELLYPTYDRVRFVSQKTYDTWFRGHPQPGDIIFVNKATPGRVCLVPDPVDFCIAQDMVAVRANERKVYPKFLFAALRSPAVQAKIGQMHVGTLIPHFKKGDFGKLLLPIPKRKTQEFIGDYYFTLSAKIELNRRMNETLAALTQSLFKSWFVDVTQATVAKGWREFTIRELAKNIQYGLTQSACTEPTGPHFLRITDIQGGRVDWGSVPYCEVSPDEYEKYRIKPDDIFVARTGASTGENIYVPAAPNAVFASYLVRFQFAEPSMARFVGAFMRTAAYFEFVAGCIGGSAQPNASAQVLAGATLVVPPQSLLKKFAAVVAPWDQRIASNNRESLSLSPPYAMPFCLNYCPARFESLLPDTGVTMEFLKDDFDAGLVAQIGADQTKIRIGSRSFSAPDVLKSIPTVYEEDFKSWMWENWLPGKNTVLSEIKRFENNDARFYELCAAAENVVPFIGSGMSVPSDVPTWSDFLRKLRRASTLKASDLEKYIKKADFESAATALENATTTKLFNECFEQTFRMKSGAEVEGPVRFLSRAFDSSVITTNFDNVLESLFEIQKLPFRQTLYGSNIKDYRRFKAAGDKCLLKLHGDYRHPATRVLTKSEYNRFYGKQSPAVEELRLIFKTHSLLFLGCSLANDRTMQLLEVVATEDHEMPKHFAFLKKPADERTRIRREQFLTERGIFAVWYDYEHDESLEALLVGILQARKRI